MESISWYFYSAKADRQPGWERGMVQLQKKQEIIECWTLFNQRGKIFRQYVMLLLSSSSSFQNLRTNDQSLAY